MQIKIQIQKYEYVEYFIRIIISRYDDKKMIMMTTMTNSMECVSLMTEVGLPQALPSDPLPGTLHFDHQNDDDVDDYNNPLPGILNFGHDDGYSAPLRGPGMSHDNDDFETNF